MRSVTSGGCGARLVWLKSLQLASFTTTPFSAPASGGRLNDMQATAVKKEGVLAKQLIELSHSRMVVGQRLGFELAQGAFDQ
jgi:hypothetical protein